MAVLNGKSNFPRPLRSLDAALQRLPFDEFLLDAGLGLPLSCCSFDCQNKDFAEASRVPRPRKMGMRIVTRAAR